jgi:hypothetical protein
MSIQGVFMGVTTGEIGTLAGFVAHFRSGVVMSSWVGERERGIFRRQVTTGEKCNESSAKVAKVAPWVNDDT